MLRLAEEGGQRKGFREAECSVNNKANSNGNDINAYWQDCDAFWSSHSLSLVPHVFSSNIQNRCIIPNWQMGTLKLRQVTLVTPSHTGNGRARTGTRAKFVPMSGLLLSATTAVVRAAECVCNIVHKKEILSFVMQGVCLLEVAKRVCSTILHSADSLY